MSNYKEYIRNSIFDGKTSLGPAKYLSDEAKNILYDMVVSEMDKSFALLDGQDSEEIFKIITKASKTETDLKQYIEKACSNWVIEIFEIPVATISVDLNLAQTIDTSWIRNKPENIEIPDSIDSERLFNEISKRRLLLSIVSGAASVLSSKLKWLKMFSKTSSELPNLYEQIITLRLCCAYDSDKKYKLSGSSFSSVFISTDGNKPEIKCDATCAPLLIEMAIKALLELAISQGLPKNSVFANVILAKADFSLANKWDLMIGIPLWKKLSAAIKKLGYSIKSLGPNFLLMELSKMNYEDLFAFINGLIINDPTSIERLKGLCESITSEKEQDEFNDFVALANDKFPLNDEYMTPEALFEESFQ